MPRIQRDRAKPPRTSFPHLIEELTAELRNSRVAGQPRIEEHVFRKTNLVRVTVLWDKWEHVPDEERTAIILEAYEQAGENDIRERIALAGGLTFPEAIEYGMLPFQIVSAVRKGDKVTLEQCREAMIAEGASVLFDPKHSQLRFATQEEAEACVQRLSARLPESEPIWLINQNLIPQGSLG